MSYLGNTPGQAVHLRVEARKSFSFAVWVKDSRGRAVDLTGCTMTIVAKPYPMDNTDDATNLLLNDSVAIIPTPKAGYARFDLQAETLDIASGEYDYVIVLRTADGYSTVIVKGKLVIEDNPEYSSVLFEYSSSNPTRSLTVELQDKNVVNVYVGGQPPPGMNFVRDEVVAALEDFDPDSIALLPQGGTAGYALFKVGNGDYEVAWRPMENGEFGLDATGQPAGVMPIAQGDGTWDWGAAGIDATGQPAGLSPVTDGADGWAWGDVSTPTPDWNATSGQPGEILNKPTLGTAATHAEEDFYASDTLVSEMQGIHFLTTVPVSGIDGHLYFVYEE